MNAFVTTLVVLEKAKGESLRKENLRPEDSDEEAKKLMERFHYIGFVHGDIRPPNVMKTGMLVVVVVVVVTW